MSKELREVIVQGGEYVLVHVEDMRTVYTTLSSDDIKELNKKYDVKIIMEDEGLYK